MWAVPVAALTTVPLAVADQASELQISVLLSEGLALAGLSHEHILAPRAVSVEPGERPLLAYSVSANYGNLKRRVEPHIYLR